VATSEPQNKAPEAPVAPVSHKVTPPTPTKPTLQIVKDNEVTLEFAVGKVGPSGVGSVEVYLTENDGLTWKLYAVDTPQMPSTPGGLCQRRLPLPGEGVFGVSLVVKSKAGLGKPPPRDGTPPQIRVEVDRTAPVAQLYSPGPDPQDREAVLITWKASDRNLTATPVTLEWSEDRKGTWHPIAADLPNTGRHSWKLPAALPAQGVFLRLRVRDSAGNESVAVTGEPQQVDLSEPEVEQLSIVLPGRSQ